jgi:hypothetical protein
VFLILEERVVLCPSFFLQIGDDVLSSGFPGFFAKQSGRLSYACLMVSLPSVFCSQSFPHEFVQPAMYILERLSE